ncbi:MAG: metal ABC transporter substrate-binding protein [Actinophytocola sp.]|uniref:metal ABC transporter solute-binding protein, Zn/Mn family n=1 Tax=Actinophytocola sp. TaxID=1872138 RepID=UPI0013274AD1|nr:zinc ABC transporter substrate-binding protein [Actinophytocola sp.]MPZ83470.1 metal ABC transporter substrate-binding protein [Actinophytocola sp.]
MRLSRSIPVLASVGLLTLALAGCGDDAGGDPGGAAADGKIAVVASTNVWGSVAQAVGGDAVSVESLINDASGDPHAHPDKPEDAIALAGADVVVYNGGGYDDFFTKLVDGTGTEAEQVDAFTISGYADGENEHVWYDLPTVRKVADKIADALGAIDAGQKSRFADNAASFGGRLDALTDTAEQIGKASPGAKVVATEPVAHYLLDAAGVTDATSTEFSEAIEEETDPPVAVVAETTELISDKQVAALVNNAQTETAVTNSLADAASKAGVPVVDVTETLPQGVTDYVEWMTEQLEALSGALSKA